MVHKKKGFFSELSATLEVILLDADFAIISQSPSRAFVCHCKNLRLQKTTSFRFWNPETSHSIWAKIKIQEDQK